MITVTWSEIRNAYVVEVETDGKTVGGFLLAQDLAHVYIALAMLVRQMLRELR